MMQVAAELIVSYQSSRKKTDYLPEAYIVNVRAYPFNAGQVVD